MENIKAQAAQQYEAFTAQLNAARASTDDGPGRFLVVNNWSQKELNELQLLVTRIRNSGSIGHFEEAQAREVFDTIAGLVQDLERHGGSTYKATLVALNELCVELQLARNEQLRQAADVVHADSGAAPAGLDPGARTSKPDPTTVATRQYEAFASFVREATASAADGPNRFMVVINWSQKELNELRILTRGILDTGSIRHMDEAQAQDIFTTLATLVQGLEDRGGPSYEATVAKLNELNMELQSARQATQ